MEDASASRTPAGDASEHLRYAVDDDTPTLLTLGLSAQVVTVVLTGIILIPIIVLTAADRKEFIEWAVFATLLVSGLATMLQARPIGAFGAGYPLYMGTSGAFIAVCTAAAAVGGLPLLATLVASSALIQFLFAARLSLFRRLITPTVGGTVILLLAVTVFPIATDMLVRLPAHVPPDSVAGPTVAFATFGVIVLISLYSRGGVQLWAPLIGILVGTVIAGAGFGMLDWTPLRDAPWFGLPNASWPGLDLEFDGRYFGLLIPFAIVTVIGAIETYGDAIAIQRVTNRGAVPVDFRAVQRAVNADGVGNLVSGLAGTMPNTTYSTSISIADLTGVGARKVAFYGGILILITAFVPKIPALLRLVPDAVAGAYVLIFIVLLFRQGVRMVTTGGFGYEKGMIVCISFWVGLGFQYGVIFPDHLPDWSRGVLDNGMAAGGLVAIALTSLVALKSRSKRAVLEPSMASLSTLGELVSTSAANAGWDESAIQRLQLAGEEAFLYLMERQEEQGAPARVSVSVRPHENALQLEFLTGAGIDNLEERLSTLDPDRTEIADAGPRILGHLGQVRHEQFYDLEALTLTVESRPLA